MRLANCTISEFETNSLQKKSSLFIWMEDVSIRALEIMIFRKNGSELYVDGKCVNSNHELRSGSFNDGFYRFWLFRAASVAIPDK